MLSYKNASDVHVHSEGKPQRTVKRFEQLNKKDETAVLRFYDELAPEATDLDVDIELIITQAFPVFQEILGNNWNKIRNYFGIGVKAPSKNIRHEEVSSLIAKLRTIENAQYYLYGFSELLEKLAAKLTRMPADMTVVEKAKVVRMFFILFCGYQFFAEDYKYLLEGKTISLSKAIQNNRRPLNPEELFYLERMISQYSDGSILYDAIFDELIRLDKKARKDVFEFAELKFEATSERFRSVNNRSKLSTFGKVRELKTRLFKRQGYFPSELYVITDSFKDLEFGELYTVYKLLKNNDFSTFDINMRKTPIVEGSRILEQIVEFRVIAPKIEMSSEEEAQRFVRFVEYLAKINFTMNIEFTVKIDDDEQSELVIQDVEIGKFFTFLEFAYSREWITKECSADAEYTMYLRVMNQDSAEEHFDVYMRGEISDEELKSRLGIDRKFEEEVLGIKHVETPLETVKRFAVESGIAENENEISESLLENVLIADKEQLWEEYSLGQIDADTLMDQLGFDHDIMEMYFKLSKIDVSVIEQKLQALKSRLASPKEIQRNALTIILYCYIIEGQIACGPKMRVPKGNKRLKPDNLRRILEAV